MVIESHKLLGCFVTKQINPEVDTFGSLFRENCTGQFSIIRSIT